VWKFVAALGILALTQALGLRETLPPSDAAEPEPLPWRQTISLQTDTSLDDTPHQAKDFSTLLQRTLPQIDLDPEQVPEFIQKKLRTRLHDYTVLHRRDIQAMLQRGAPYLPLIKRLLRQYNLPSYFAYVPLAESAFQADAAHPESGARGLWQLMPNTARAYGLQVSAAVDERLDPFLATRAAARYLQELQAMFGKNMPLLILAAYNFGESNLSKAILRTRSRNIWTLFRKRQIPFQTREYLIKMLSLWIIVMHAEHYRFTAALQSVATTLPFTEITFSHPVSLPALARQIALPEERLRSLNPHMLQAEVPSYTPIRIPSASVEAFLNYEVRLAPSLSTERCCARLMVLDTCWHTVVTGETLSAIARRYAIDLSTIKLLNQLEGANPIIHPGQRLAVCDVPASITASEVQLW
jgi:membrane-bound lytic murein transglycosylase D